jgi:citrate synthase
MAAPGVYLSASEAASALGVTKATLYAYISRGLLRSEPLGGRSRAHRYLRQDVVRLQERKEARRDPARAVARGLHWGGPVLDSAITLIHAGRLFYRGRDATTLARTMPLEAVAALLWEADGPMPDPFARPLPRVPPQWQRAWADARRTITAMQIALAAAGERDVAACDLRPASVRAAGARILQLLTAAAAGASPRQPIHRALQVAWCPRDSRAAEAIRAALVLCADHELNVSAFTARCAASAGATPYDVVSAALATLKGHRHGGAGERVMALFAASTTAQAAASAAAQRLRLGEGLPGFGHPLYPEGDPRAAALLRIAKASANRAQWQQIARVARIGTDLLGDFPNLDFGLAAITKAYRLPADAPLVLFAIGRSAGWIAHALETYATGQLIRPRARYTGLPPA